MSEDIVTRLREGSRYRVLDGEAADEIERLRTEAARDFLERKRLESQVMEHAIDHARAQRACNELRAAIDAAMARQTHEIANGISDALEAAAQRIEQHGPGSITCVECAALVRDGKAAMAKGKP